MSLKTNQIDTEVNVPHSDGRATGVTRNSDTIRPKRYAYYRFMTEFVTGQFGTVRRVPHTHWPAVPTNAHDPRPIG